MKNILKFLMVVMFLVGCSKNKDITKPIEKLNIELSTQISTYDVDMSAYNNMTAYNHQFLGLSPDEFLKVEDVKATGIFMFGFNRCHACQKAVSNLNEVAKTYDLKVYYIDCYSKVYPFQPKYEQIIEKIGKILSLGEDKKPALFTPEVIAIKNGEIVDHHSGIPQADGELNDQQIQELKDHYQKLFESLRTK